MNRASFHVLRVGMAITFIWIGLLILKDPSSWSGYIQDWVLGMLPVPAPTVMVVIGILDIVTGVLLLVNILTWPAALYAASHLLIVLVVSGINAITVRDIGLFAAAVALVFDSVPQKYLERFK